MLKSLLISRILNLVVHPDNLINNFDNLFNFPSLGCLTEISEKIAFIKLSQASFRASGFFQDGD